MKTIIAGSRQFNNYDTLLKVMEKVPWTPTLVLSGAARGADKLGEDWATATSTRLRRFPAEWKKYGQDAGFKRNLQMAEEAEALIAFWDGKSQGTKHMIDTARKRGLIIYVAHIQC